MLTDIPKTNKDEEFKFIPKSDNKYAISNYGNVYSFKRNRFLTLTKTTNTRVANSKATSYYRVKLRLNNKPVIKSVHRYVAELFIINTEPNKTQVNHIDSNGLNNHSSNLEWVTPSENVIHAIINGHHITSDKIKVKENLHKGNITQSQNERAIRLSKVGTSFGGSTLIGIEFENQTTVKLSFATLKCNLCDSIRTCTESTFRTYVNDRKHIGYCQKCTNRHGKYKI